MEFSVKAYLQKEDSTVEVRRIPVNVEGPNIYKQTLARVRQSFPGLKEKLVTLKWRDSDGDYVLMSSDEEVTEALSQSAGAPLKIYITVEDRQDMPPEADKSSEQHNHNRDFSEDSQEDPIGFPFIPPTPPTMPHFFGPGSPGGKKSHHGPFQGHWSFEGHFPFGGQGPFSHGPFSSQSHFGTGGHGSFGRHGPFHGQGPFHGHGPLGRHGPFGHGHFSSFAHGPFGPFFHHQQHNGFEKDCKRKCNKDGWKKKLRDAVPVAHRRWAKYYIRNWRVTNLKNATTTSSESDQEHVTLESANVPEAYAKWLDHILVKWHRRWNQELSEEGKSANGDQNTDKKQLKASVPKEFRKWTKWYLARHFGQKEAPIFYEDFQHMRGHCHGKGKKFGGVGKKIWKKAYKMHFLDSSVPLKYRIWARHFISDWRQQNKISDAENNTSGTESDDLDTEKQQGKITVPNDYSKWLILFLNKWHINRGLMQGQKSCKYEMEMIKEKVPWDFRKWVKCYLWQRYMKFSGDMSTSKQYQKWMGTFQKKWLKDQSSESDGLNLTSSEEEAGTTISGKASDKEVEKSFKKLRLDEQTSLLKSVSFSDDQRKPSPCGADNEESIESSQNKKNWAKEDGKTSCVSSAGASDEEMNQWMTKMMMKMQMKKMKKDLKEARKERKAEAKAQKYFRM